ncbi:MAG: hypothetical protein ACPGNT_03535 [Rhodospirillales bacterium]
MNHHPPVLMIINGLGAVLGGSSLGFALKVHFPWVGLAALACFIIALALPFFRTHRVLADDVTRMEDDFRRSLPDEEGGQQVFPPNRGPLIKARHKSGQGLVLAFTLAAAALSLVEVWQVLNQGG